VITKLPIRFYTFHSFKTGRDLYFAKHGTTKLSAFWRGLVVTKIFYKGGMIVQKIGVAVKKNLKPLSWVMPDLVVMVLGKIMMNKIKTGVATPQSKLDQR